VIGYATRRLAAALVTAWVASIVAFVLFWTIPNVDPAYWLGGAEKGTDATRAGATEKYGLDHPLPVQYVRLMKSILNGDIECFYNCGSLRAVFFDALPVTISLVGGAGLIAVGPRRLAGDDLHPTPGSLAGPPDHHGRDGRLLGAVARPGGRFSGRSSRTGGGFLRGRATSD